MMNHFYKYILTLLTVAACSSVNTPINTQATHQWRENQGDVAFEASGRLSIKMQQTGHSASFDWTRQNQVETLDITAPLGITIGQLCQDNAGVIATDYRQRQYTAATPEELGQQLLGYPLPLQYLRIWANGEWVKHLPHQFGEQGQLQQLGWQISREVGEDGNVRALQLQNEQWTLRMAFSQYTAQPISQTPSQCAARSLTTNSSS